MKKIIAILLSVVMLTTPVYASDLNLKNILYMTNNVPQESLNVENSTIEELIDEKDLGMIRGGDLDDFISIEVDRSKLKNAKIISNTDFEEKDKNGAIGRQINDLSLLSGTDSKNEVEYWSQYSCHFIDDQLTEVERNFFDNLDKVFYNYLLTDEDISNNVYVESKISSIQDVINLCYMYRYARPQFYFLRPRMSYYRYKDKEDGNYYIALSLKSYDMFFDGKFRATITPQIKKQLDEWVYIVKSCTNEYFKAKKIHDLIINKVDYDYPVIADNYDWDKDARISQSMYSTICTNYTVCAGYSITYSAVANAVGLTNSSITGSGHAWNTIQVDGDWYFIDACWDDSRSYYVYFLVSSAYCMGRDNSHIRYYYWNKFVPQCTAQYRSLNNLWSKYYGDPGHRQSEILIDYDLNIKSGTTHKINNLYTIQTSLYPYMYNQKIGKLARDGYIFDGYYYNGELITRFPKDECPDMIISVHWKPIKYNVQFVKNGGSIKENKKIKGKMSKMTKLEFDTGYNLPENKFTRKGYKFLGWSTNKKDATPMFKDQGSIMSLTTKSGGTVKLYAIWQKE